MFKRFFLGLLLFLLSVNSVTASDDFYSAFDVTYKFNSLGEAQVDQHISLTNNFSHVYPVSYQIILKGEFPTNVTAKNSHGPLKVTSEKSPEGTTLTIQLKDAAAGKGQVTRFTLSYSGKSAINHGQIWELALPKFTNSDFADDYTLHLITPENFGRPAYIFPAPDETTGHSFTFSKSQIMASGVTAAFGNFQTFSFNLTYVLNPSPSLVIPSDTNQQKVYYKSITPKPKSITVDQDGNWLAEFAKGQSEITLTGLVNVESSPAKISPPRSIYNYLSPQKYWEVTDATISDLAKRLGTAENIYNYVASTLKYDSTRVNQNPARRGLSALSNPTSSLCTDFTDLFIALARSAGIPAREVNGFAYTTDPTTNPASLGGAVLHAWPQYWNKDLTTWVNIDPTWGMTSGGINYFSKLDLNHFALVTHGVSSETPQLLAKTVTVDFASFTKPPETRLDITWAKPFQLWPFIKVKSTITLYNPGPVALYNVPVVVNSKEIAFLKTLPPYAHIQLPIYLLAPKYLTISAGGSQVTYNIPTRLTIIWPLTVILGLSICIIALAHLAGKAWGIHLQRRKR